MHILMFFVHLGLAIMCSASSHRDDCRYYAILFTLAKNT